MSEKAFNKKTLGIKNKELLLNCGLLCFMLSFLVHFILIINLLTAPKAKPGVDVEAQNNMGKLIAHFLGYYFLQFCLMFLLCCASGKIHHWLWGFITIFHIFYLYNPWIAHCHKNAYPVSEHFKLLLTSFKIIFPMILCVHVFATFIFWRMSKVKPDYDGDEPYEVIYGGEGSSTKKSDESVE